MRPRPKPTWRRRPKQSSQPLRSPSPNRKKRTSTPMSTRPKRTTARRMKPIRTREAKLSRHVTPKPWMGGSGNYGALRESRARGSDPSYLNFLGGMRNPSETVAGMPGSLNLGLRIFAAWERFIAHNSQALETAATYGTKECRFDPMTVER